jgi:hypothetical protein
MLSVSNRQRKARYRLTYLAASGMFSCAGLYHRFCSDFDRARYLSLARWGSASSMLRSLKPKRRQSRCAQQCRDGEDDKDVRTAPALASFYR